MQSQLIYELIRLIYKWTKFTPQLEHLQNDRDYNLLLKHIFWNWEWTFTISSYIFNIFMRPIDDQGPMNRESRFQRALGCAGSSVKGDATDEFRSRIVKADNCNFCSQLEGRLVSEINFRPSELDQKYWDILAAMYLRSPDQMLFWMSSTTRRRVFKKSHPHLEWFSGHFSIPIVSRIFDLSQRRPNNSDRIRELLTKSPTFQGLKADLLNARAENHDLLQYMDEPEYLRDTPGEAPGEGTRADDELAAPELNSHDREKNKTAYQTGTINQQSGTVETADSNIDWQNVLLTPGEEDAEEDTARVKELKGHNMAVGVSALPFFWLPLSGSNGDLESSRKPHRCKWTRS